jgi:hypothetical protein
MIWQFKVAVLSLLIIGAMLGLGKMGCFKSYTPKRIHKMSVGVLILALTAFTSFIWGVLAT